jgi:hypothetical protein
VIMVDSNSSKAICMLIHHTATIPRLNLALITQYLLMIAIMVSDCTSQNNYCNAPQILTSIYCKVLKRTWIS